MKSSVLFCSWISLIFSLNLQAAGKKPHLNSDVRGGSEWSGRKVVGLAPLSSLQIEMPDGSMHNFGEDFQASLTTQLMQTGRYTVSDAMKAHGKGTQRDGSEYVWSGSVTPAATVTVQVAALNFSTGLRGERMFYGFEERFKNPFNDGSGVLGNEFPLRPFILGHPSWFGASFDQNGTAPFDSRAGLDLGDGFNINFLFAYLKLKYASYHSELRLTLILDPIFSPAITKNVSVSGDGFFVDVAGGYAQYSAGLVLARSDAMNQALQKAISGTFHALDQSLRGFPLQAKVDAVLRDGTLLLGTGPDSGVPRGVLYEVVDHPELIVQVSSSVHSGSIGAVVKGDSSLVRVGTNLSQIHLLTSKLASSQLPQGSQELKEVVHLKAMNLSQSKGVQAQLSGLVPDTSLWSAFLMSLLDSAFLPYRIWRYFAYDQAYHQLPDSSDNEEGRSGRRGWDLNHESWSEKIGLAHLRPLDFVPVVAIMDSGMDYNHPALHHSLWLNPISLGSADFGSEGAVGKKDRYGWDFVSEDSRPYDDGYHGTQLASVVLGVAPRAKIMPIKIFNAWGVTTSAAIYGAFTYAVDHGAQVILCGWATSRASQAILMGVTYAKDHGVIVVAAAGDDGINLSELPYYPAVLSKNLDNVLTVTGVDANDQLFNQSTWAGLRKANYGSGEVFLAAPGLGIPVAEPRVGSSHGTSTGLAAAMVAGSLVRYMDSSSGYQHWIEDLLGDADRVLTLDFAVRGGLRLHVRR